MYFFEKNKIPLNYLYGAATVAMWRQNWKDLAVVSIAVSIGTMRVRNKVNEDKVPNFNKTVM